MPYTLSLNTNPLVNRFAEPVDLIDTVALDLRIRDLQLTHEFINPSWPAPVIRKLVRQTDLALERTGMGHLLVRWHHPTLDRGDPDTHHRMGLFPKGETLFAGD